MRVKLLHPLEYDEGILKLGALGTVTGEYCYGALLRVHWDEGIESFVVQKRVEAASVLDDLLTELDSPA